MADDTTRAELARLRDAFATQQLQIASLQAALRHRRHSAPRRLLPLALAALLVALVPLGSISE
jgi:hypothetical protein